MRARRPMARRWTMRGLRRACCAGAPGATKPAPCESASRNREVSHMRDADFGFRVARGLGR